VLHSSSCLLVYENAPASVAASTSLAVTNATSLLFYFKDMQLFNVTLRQNAKLDSFRLALTFQIKNPLSCKRV